MSDLHTLGLRPGATLPARMAAAYKDGRDSARALERRRVPWPGDDPDPTVRVLAKMWARGYSAGNPVQL